MDNYYEYEDDNDVMGIPPFVFGFILGTGIFGWALYKYHIFRRDVIQAAFNVSDLVGAISGGNGGLMDAVSKYGSMFGLDQDGDGTVGMSDAIAAVTNKSGGIGGIFGKLFGGK